MRSCLRLSVLAAAILGALWAGRRVTTVGTDDRAIAHVHRTHPEFRPRLAMTASVDESNVEMGLTAQAVIGAAVFLLARRGLHRHIARRSDVSLGSVDLGVTRSGE